MKNQALSLATGYCDPVLENTIKKKDAEIKERVRKNAMHYASRNCPRPMGDKLLPYIGEAKGGYEELAAYIQQYLQPATHYPEARMEADYANEKNKQLISDIANWEEQNQNDSYDLQRFNPHNVGSRIRTALILTLIIFIGDSTFNTAAFQLTGQSLLFSLLLSISLSFAVFILTHLAPLLYKEATTRLKKTLIVIGTLTLATTLFIALAVFRSALFASQSVSIKPVYFVIINLFFFIVSALLSYYILPCYEEIKEHWIQLMNHKNIRKREKEINQLKKDKENLKTDILKSAKHHMRTTYYSKYLVERTKKMYQEAVAIFQSTNLAFRSDHQTPDCFHQLAPELDIDDSTISSHNLNSKQQ